MNPSKVVDSTEQEDEKLSHEQAVRDIQRTLNNPSTYPPSLGINTVKSHIQSLWGKGLLCIDIIEQARENPLIPKQNGRGKTSFWEVLEKKIESSLKYFPYIVKWEEVNIHWLPFEDDIVNAVISHSTKGNYINQTLSWIDSIRSKARWEAEEIFFKKYATWVVASCLRETTEYFLYNVFAKNALQETRWYKREEKKLLVWKGTKVIEIPAEKGEVWAYPRDIATPLAEIFQELSRISWVVRETKEEIKLSSIVQKILEEEGTKFSKKKTLSDKSIITWTSLWITSILWWGDLAQTYLGIPSRHNDISVDSLHKLLNSLFSYPNLEKARDTLLPQLHSILDEVKQLTHWNLSITNIFLGITTILAILSILRINSHRRNPLVEKEHQSLKNYARNLLIGCILWIGAWYWAEHIPEITMWIEARIADIKKQLP